MKTLIAVISGSLAVVAINIVINKTHGSWQGLVIAGLIGVSVALAVAFMKWRD